MHQANPKLSELITEKLGSKDWLKVLIYLLILIGVFVNLNYQKLNIAFFFFKDLFKLKQLENFVDDESFRKRWTAIKHSNKVGCLVTGD